VNPLPITNVHGFYDYRLVALSVLLAVGASYAALDLVGRVTAARGRSRRFWLVGGATAMGLGIWAMHYVGMLACRLPMPVRYDVPTVGLSLFAAIGASAVALVAASGSTMGRRRQIIGSVVVGGGIAAMHYIGMGAMRAPAEVRYTPAIVVFSIVLSIVISRTALTLLFRGREEKHTSWRKIVNALAMGSAIPLMHYTGMAASVFSSSKKMPDLSHAVGISSLGVASISIGSLLVLAVVIVTAFVDRLQAANRSLVELSRENEAHFRHLAEAIPQIVWTAHTDGQVDYVNQRWLDYTGLDLEYTHHHGWQCALLAEDSPLCAQHWTRSLQTGETFEWEYRLRRAGDGAYRWHLGRAVTVKDSKGSVIRWLGTCTDIDDQKSHQRVLEEQIKERTAEVLAANIKLTLEMRERERAQNELNEQNAAMVQELAKRSGRAILLAGMGKLLQSSNSIEEAISIILGIGPKIFREFRGALMLLNASRNRLEIVGTWADCAVPAASIFDVNSCWALRTGLKHFVEVGDRTAPCAHALSATNSYLCIPIMTQGGLAGVLHLQSMTSTREPLESELLLTSSFVEQVGLSISNLKLQEALRQQSTRDGLTGLFNRRYLEESLEREIHSAARADQPVGVIMFDLDHFKRFNDDFGHEAGDCVLRELAAYLAKTVRAGDIPCRFGGEEFVLILPGATLEGAQTRAERLRTEVKTLSVVYQGKSLGTITISVGVSGAPFHGSSVKELIAAADGALYKAKKNGRDRVVLAERRQIHGTQAPSSTLSTVP
jgi:diguanylate cyclase (GGDEF)-like protein/PAS domain S-box-containing protein